MFDDEDEQFIIIKVNSLKSIPDILIYTSYLFNIIVG